MIAWWLAVALAGTVTGERSEGPHATQARPDEAPAAHPNASLQTVLQLVWDRAPAVTVAAAASGEPVPVRIAAARGLGSFRRADALVALDAMRADPDPAVQVAVADALGSTPGAAPALRAWLDALPAPTGPAPRAAADGGPRTRAIEALGRQGDLTDLPRLVALLGESWPTSAAAAEALGRFGRRALDGADAALPPLVDALDRPDPRTVEAAAYAIRRIGLKKAPQPLVDRVVARLTRVGDPETRAWLLSAAWPRLSAEQKLDRFVAATLDPSPLVQVAVLDAVGKGDVPVEILAPWWRSPDPWVRQAAVAALGRAEEFGALGDGLRGLTDPWEIAWVVEAATGPLGLDWKDEALDPVVRAAVLAVSDDVTPAERIELAKSSPAPLLRTAAVSPLLEAEPKDPAWADALLGATDPVVREAGLELLGAAPPERQVEALILHLRAEKDLELLGTGLARLAALIEQDPKRVKPGDPHLESAVRRALKAPVARVRLAAERVAGLIGLPVAPGERLGKRELVLPSGTVVEVAAGAPIVEDVLRIRGARVETDRGTFTIALDPEIAPLAVANFATLAESGFYDGRVFHRVVPGFVVQTGCPRGDGWGGPGWTLPDELSGVPYATGSVGMARSDADTGGSQWFVSTAPTWQLEGDYTRFGAVVQGQDVVRALRRGDHVLRVTIERLEAP